MQRQSRSHSLKLLLLGLAFTLSLAGILAFWIVATDFNTSNMISDTRGEQRVEPRPLILNSVHRVEQLVGKPLALPSGLNNILPGFRVLGVEITIPRQLMFYDEGRRSFPYFYVTIYLWDKPFVNGTTTGQEILKNGGIVIMESAFAGDERMNVTLAVTRLMNPDVGYGTYTTQIKGRPVAVNPRDHEIGWPDTERLMWIVIHAPSMTKEQMIKLVEILTP